MKEETKFEKRTWVLNGIDHEQLPDTTVWELKKYLQDRSRVSLSRQVPQGEIKEVALLAELK